MRARAYRFVHTHDAECSWALQLPGELVGVADTGLDFHSCMFSDSEAIAATAGTPTAATALAGNHRNVALYWNLMDWDDDWGGHGTHVVRLSCSDVGMVAPWLLTVVEPPYRPAQ